MRKWRCVHVNEVNKKSFTIGKVYKSDKRGYNIVGDNGFRFDSLSADETIGGGFVGGGGFVSTKFEEVFEEKEENNMKFKVGDKVRVLDGSKIKGYNGGWFTSMSKNIGMIARISECLDDGYKLKDSHFGWRNYIYDGRGLELVSDKSNKTLTITTSDTTTTLTDGTHTTTVKRYVGDKHNERNAVGFVVDKYYDELEEIERVSRLPKVGDKVKVIDRGQTYPTYSEWLIENKVDIKYAIKWKNKNEPANGEFYTIVSLYPHSKEWDEVLALVDGENGTFLIGLDGLEVVK